MAIFGLTNESNEEVTSENIETNEINNDNIKYNNVRPTNDEINSTPVFESEDLPIVTQIGGYEWEVNYYNLIADISDYQSTVDTSLDLAITEYNKINNLIIYLDSPLDNTIPEEMTGEGLINVPIIPKNGDFFTARLLDGRIGVFYLTGVRKEKYNLYDVYKITFKLYHIVMDENDSIFEKLKAKTVNEYYYNKDYGLQRSTPLYTKEEYVDIKKIDTMVKSLIQYFNDTYLSYNHKTLEIIYEKDGVVERVLDPYLENFIREVIGLSNLPRDVYFYGYKQKGISILDFMMNNLISPMEVYVFINPVYSNKYGSNIYLKQAVWAGIDYIIELSKTYNPDKIDLLFLKGETGETGKSPVPYLNNYYPKLNDTTYIFGKTFYILAVFSKVSANLVEKENYSIDDLTLFEKVMLGIINREQLNFDDLITLYNNIWSLNNIEKFYYIPMLILAFKYFKYKLPITNI